jgi:hypothetical protein
MDNSYYGTCRIQAIVPGKVHGRNLAEPGGRQAKDFKEAAIRGKWPLPSSMLHNVMIFMICTMGRRKKTCPLCLVSSFSFEEFLVLAKVAIIDRKL